MTPSGPVVVCVAAGGEEPDGSPLELALAALDRAGRADVVLLTGPAPPVADWLDALVEAARCDTTIASASAMCEGSTPVPAGAIAGSAAAVAVRSCSARVRPRIAVPAGSAVLLRRSALDAAGGLDPGLGGLAAALADWGERCVALGFGHVLADDLLASSSTEADPPGAEVALIERWPAHREHVATLAAAPALERALEAAARGLAPLSVTLDCRALNAVRSGTQVHALELAAAIVRTGRVRLRVVVPPDLDDDARAALSANGGAELLSYRDAAAGAEPTDVVHRPSQVFSVDDLTLLVPLGRRLVITHQDLISYRLPGYHADTDTWRRFRSVTRHALGAADHVVFFSEHALRDALGEDLVDRAHADVVRIGVDHAAVPAATPVRPAGFRADGRGYLLCLGADLQHKHRVFALRLLGALRRRGWDGELVLAGGHVQNGSSKAEEDRLLAADPDLAGAVKRLPAVDEPERLWLTAHATAIAYPTLYEGFGLVPFESAAAGVPTLFASQTALAELLPAELAVLSPWDPEGSAEASLPLLTDPGTRRSHVEAVKRAGRELTWDRTANMLVDCYEALVARPPREATAGPRARLRLERLLDESEGNRRAEAARFEEYKSSIGADALALVGPEGLLGDADQRALLALAARSGPRRVLFALLRSLYRVAHRLR